MVAQSASVHFKHPEGGFLFVNANHPDDVKRRSTQRSIRSHSIRGAFRGRQGRKRKPQAVTYALEEVYADWGTCRDQITREQFPIQKSLDSWPFPSKLNNRAQELIYFMNAESDYVFRPFRTVWFSLALTDATAFQLCMANAAMFMAQRKRPDTFQFEKCSEALEYYGHCLRQVTKRLECRDDCTSEGVIVTVLGLICHDMYVGSRTRWATHIRGLHRIIQLRGGHQNIKSNLALWASWYDVLGSATDDTYPYFPEYMDNYLPSSLPLRTPLLKHIICKLMQEDYVSMHPIINALDRVRVIADTVNSRHHEPEFWRREDDLSPLHMIGPVTHILLSIPRLSPETDILDSNKLFREMARLCMLILLTSLKRLYSFALDEIEFTTLTAKFSSVLSIYRRSPSLYQSDDALHRLQLWTILIVASLQPFVDRTPYVTEIRRCMNYMGIASATDAFQLSRDIAWIDVVCGTNSENESLFNAIDNATHP